MNPLEREIRRLIEAEGPISISRYMALCLSHPRYGYYMSRDPFGAAGDFVTAPELSQMFGELLGLWCAEVWQAMGAPSPVHLVELGPGRGTLAADMLRAMKVAPQFRAAFELHLVETSPRLAEQQRAALASAGAATRWHRHLETLPDGPLLAVANEFVDALPIDQIVMTEDGWHERRIGIVEERLVLGLDPTSLPGVESQLPAHLRRAPVGTIVERRDLAPIRELARRIAAHGGAALIVDYGHERSGSGDTLQAVRAHRTADPLADPGEADLTAHVDFEALAAAVEREGTRAHGPVAQGVFLRRLGIEQRAERLKHGKDDATRRAIDAALARLTRPAPGMGELFKVLAIAHRDMPTLPGLTN